MPGWGPGPTFNKEARFEDKLIKELVRLGREPFGGQVPVHAERGLLTRLGLDPF